MSVWKFMSRQLKSENSRSGLGWHSGMRRAECSAGSQAWEVLSAHLGPRITKRRRLPLQRFWHAKASSAGVSPAVAGASRTQQVLTSPSEKRSIETEDELQEGAGRMPTPQRARRPRYVRDAAFWTTHQFQVQY